MSAMARAYSGRYEKTPGNKAVLGKIEVQAVQDYLNAMGQSWPGLGGLSKLLRSLEEAFVFERIEPTELAGQPTLPAWKLYGRWKPEWLAEMLPESEQGAVAAGRVDTGELPPQLPEVVVLYLGKEDLFPYRLEYHRDTVSQSSGEQWPAPWAMQLELYEVSFRGPIAEDRFKFTASLDPTDETAAFIEGLGNKR